MTHLFAVTELEAHLIEMHDVSPEMIGNLRKRFDKPAELIVSQSHSLMHAMETPMKEHTHE